MARPGPQPDRNRCFRGEQSRSRYAALCRRYFIRFD